jgi:hypothetical protein
LPKRNDDLFEFDEGGEDDSWIPADFFDLDTSEDDMDTIHEIQDLIGKPVSQIIEDADQVYSSGRAGSVRGVRFSSGSEALLWLFRRGIFLFSSLVRFSDGSWGVAIGESERPLKQEKPQDDIPF